MLLFCDFDDVLFNTRSFVDAVADTLGHYGIDRATFDATRQQFSHAYGEQKSAVYTFDHHVCALTKDAARRTTMLRALGAMVRERAREFVFNDAWEFLRDPLFSRRIIVTFGERDHQLSKIRACGLDTLVDDVIVSAGTKGADIAAAVDAAGADHEKIIFCDDRVEYLESARHAVPSVRTFFVDRPEGRWHDAITNAVDYRVTSLMEVREIMRTCEKESVQ